MTPLVEVFYVSRDETRKENPHAPDAAERMLVGWYWCLADPDPIGPFATEAEAQADAQAESGGQ